jgi:hypothetical protein
VLAVSSLNEPVAKRIANLFRMLASDFDGEVLATVTAMKRLFTTEGLTFHDIATVIESCNGEIEERKYSDSDAEIIFARGVEKGHREGVEDERRKRDQIIPADYYDEDGQPRWQAIARFCQRNHARLRASEATFVDEMVANTMWRGPTEKQGRWLLTIFLRLGGRRAA